MKVTVLVAAYNTAKYLGECLDSLISQTYTDLEVMCVDDCSTDGTWEVMQRYAAMDQRIVAYRLPVNSGQAVARNYAIERSTGDLVCFLDSDDWFAPDAIERAVEVFVRNEHADCVLFRLRKVWLENDGSGMLPTENGDIITANECTSVGIQHEEDYEMEARFPLSGSEAFELSLDWSIHGVYMVRGELQREVLYDDVCRSFSDDNTTRLHFYRSREVHLCDGVYYYRQNPQSVSHVCDLSRLNFLKANEHMHQMLMDMHVPQRLLDIHTRVRWLNLVGCYMFYYDNRGLFSAEDKQKAIHELCRVWHSIDTDRLPLATKHKLGYMPCPSWTLFRLQEEVYFTLRKIRDCLKSLLR